MHFLIVGIGSIGERHLRSFQKIEGVRCSIAEVNPTAREKMAAQYHVEAAYADYREADLKSFDGVVICTPTNLHIPIAADVVSADTHVLMEKPLGMSLDGVEELKRLRDEKGFVVSVAFTLRSDPISREVKERVASGELGGVKVINYYAGQYWPRMRKDYPPLYAQSRKSGGGVIPDHLIHQVNFMEWMFGPAEEVSAKQWKMGLPEIATEDTGHMVMRYSGGQVAFFGICIFQHDTITRLTLIAEQGTIQTEFGTGRVDVFRDEIGEWTRGRSYGLERDDVMRLQAQHFIDCIQGRATPRCTIEEAEQTLRTILAALESSDTDGRFIKVTRP